MSHFTVAIFTKEGQTVEELLAPYEEKEVERYLEYTKEQLIEKGKKEIEEYKNGELYQEFIKSPIDYRIKHNLSLEDNHYNYLKYEFPKKLNWTDEEIYQDQIEYYEKEDIGENGETYSTYNPNSEWDWYQIGGRWSGNLKLKSNATSGKYGERSWANENQVIPENMVDSAKVKDIDFIMDEEEYKKALRYWELIVEEDIPQNENEENMIKWNIYKKEYYTKRYKDKEEYAKVQSEFGTYAVITPDGKWHSKGEMGYWGCSSETGEEARAWNLSFKEKFIDTADPEWILTVVDCHI